MNDSVEISLSPGEALVLYELLVRFQESEASSLEIDRAEWRALIHLLGAIERQGAIEGADYAERLAGAQRELADYDGFPAEVQPRWPDISKPDTRGG